MSDATPQPAGTDAAGTETGRRIRSVDTLRIGLLSALGLLASIRLLPLPSVFVGNRTVLSSNDPYYYRHLVEGVVGRAVSPLDVGALGALPSSARAGEPLLVAALAWPAELLGGSARAVGIVLAVYPVIAAILTGVLVFLLARRLTGDGRVGVAAVAFLAVVPAHAFRTGLGFADHHAFDYLWLVLTVLALVTILGDVDGDRRPAWIAAFGVAVAGQTLAWEGSPLLLVPLALSLAVGGPIWAGSRGGNRLGQVALGLGVATAITGGAHTLLGWHEPAVVAVPALLLIGTAGIALLVALGRRTNAPGPVVAGGEMLTGGLALLVVGSLAPSLVEGFATGTDRLITSGTIAETVGLGGSFGPLIGPTIMLGFTVFLGLPALAWGLWRGRRAEGAGWLVTGTYCLFFLVLATVQRRFTGELAPLLSVFAGVGFLGLLSWLSLASEQSLEVPDAGAPHAGTQDAHLELPSRRAMLSIGGLYTILAAFPAIYSAVLHSRVTVASPRLRAARWMAGYAKRSGWPVSRRYVFSPWGENRMYNYVVRGRSRSFAFARRRYGAFLRARDPERWYERLAGRVGFIVVEPLSADLGPTAMYSRLYHQFGSGTDRVDGLGHYRLVYLEPQGGIRVFTLVPGATIEGKTTPGARLEVATDVSVPGAEFRYERETQAGESGTFSLTVPYPGEYTVGDTQVTVSKAAVRDGSRVGSVEAEG